MTLPLVLSVLLAPACSGSGSGSDDDWTMEQFWLQDYPEAICAREAECEGEGHDLEACLDSAVSGGEQMLELDCSFRQGPAQDCLDAIATWPCDDDPSTNPECDDLVATCG